MSIATSFARSFVTLLSRPTATVPSRLAHPIVAHFSPTWCSGRPVAADVFRRRRHFAGAIFRCRIDVQREQGGRG